MDKTITEQKEIIDFFNKEVSIQRLTYEFRIKQIERKYKERIFKACSNPIRTNQSEIKLWIYNTGGYGEGDPGFPINLNDIEFIETKNWAPNDLRKICSINLKKNVILRGPENSNRDQTFIVQLKDDNLPEEL